MAVREILLFGNETLRQRSEEVTEFNEELWTLLDDMYDTMTEANGIGLAAPQIGVLKRVVVIDVDDDNGIIELVNPVIESMSGEQTGEEGCLSIPNRYESVTRPMTVTVRAQDRKGNSFTITAEGFKARALCHEIDHLDGILYIDKTDKKIRRRGE